MRTLFLFSLLICMSFATKLSAETEAQGMVKLESMKRLVMIPTNWLPPMQDAVARFHETGQDLGCFHIILGERKDSKYISFLPYPDVEILDDGELTIIDMKTHCGTGLTFKYSLAGEFIKQVYIR